MDDLVRTENKKYSPKIKMSEQSTILCSDVAADEGFEPSRTESESGVLPLH